LLLLVVACIAARTIYRRCSLIGQGRPVGQSDEAVGGRFSRFLLYVPAQWSNVRNVSRRDLAGIQHLMLFWGGMILPLYYLFFFFVGDGLALQGPLRDNAVARIFLPVAEIFALLVMIALAWGVARRTLLKPARLGPDFEATLFLVITVSASALLVTFFALEGLRFNLGIASYAGPVSGVLAGWFQQMPGYTLALMFHVAWWIQGVLLACFMVYVPYSSHQHALFAPFNILASSPKPKGRISKVEMDESYRGLAGVNGFTWKQLLELYGCTQCGRCQNACPAAAAGKALSPKKVIQDLRIWLDETGDIRPFWKGDEAGAAHGKELCQRISDEEVWSCTTCMACVQACPAFVSSLDKIIDLRRDRVLAKGKIFPEVIGFFRDLETFGDVFGKGRTRRDDWALGSNVRILPERGETDTLFWVGCQASFHDRSSKSAVALAEVLSRGGVDMAIMGKGELCCGDPMRRLGNEHQFQNFVRKNIENLKKLRFKRIVTYCPHCYNTLKNEYPQFGGDFEVVHYTELLDDLIRTGALRLKKAAPAKVAYHDPCYLARGNGIVKGKDILAGLLGQNALDVERSGEKTFCCGGGGGAMWMRETGGSKINELRVQELVQGDPGVIATSCPFCVVMLEDGVKSLGLEHVQCKDLIEIVREMV
jgi:Fe-S oxidoreductase